MHRRYYWLFVPVISALVAVTVYARRASLEPESPGGIPEPALEVKDRQPEKPKPCRDTFERVAKGMTLEQATAVIGAQPGVYIRGKLGSDVVLAPRGLGWIDYVRWVADDAELLVLFVDSAGAPIAPEMVQKDDRIFEVHVWDVINTER
jgi:hypothetical protein